MAAVTFVEFNCLSRDFGRKIHDFAADDFRAYLSNTAPDITTEDKAGLPTEIAAGNGYPLGGLLVDLSQQETDATTEVFISAPVVLTAAGAIGPFRYVSFYNASAPGLNVLGYYDRGGSATISVDGIYTIPAATLFIINP